MVGIDSIKFLKDGQFSLKYKLKEMQDKEALAREMLDENDDSFV